MRAAFGFGFGLPLGDSGDAPAIDWNFAGGVLPSALTFSRASLATMYDAAGTLVTASSGSPRLTYDPVTHAALGLLVEEQRTNLLLNSLLDGTNLSTQSVTVAATQYTLSFYGTGQIVLSGSATATVVGTGAFPTQKTYTFTPSAGSLTLTVTGTVQFAQLEAGAFATSYIPTGAASATRAADVVTCTGAAFSSWVNGTEGTLLDEFACAAMSNSPSGASLNGYGWNDNSTQALWWDGVANTATPSTVAVGQARRQVVAWDAAGYSISANGSTPTTVTGRQPWPSARSALQLGGIGSIQYINGPIKRVRYWRKRLTNAQLQALTA